MDTSNFLSAFLSPGKIEQNFFFKNQMFNGKIVSFRIFAASLGTVAACLSSLSAVTMEDLLIAGMNVKIAPQKGALYAKWMSVG